MKMRTQFIVTLAVAAMVSACSSKHKIEKIKTDLKDSQSVGSETLGKNADGQYVLQKKENLASHLLDLQREVFQLEEGIYGNKSYGNKGKYGVLEDCRIELRAKTNGKWEMVESAPKTILSQEEAKISKKVGIDEKGQLVMLTEEELTGRIKRFERYKSNYLRQDDWYDTEIKACKTGLKNFAKDKTIPQETPVTSFPDYSADLKSDMNTELCKYVDSNASLKTLVKMAVNNGWVLEEDLAERPYVNNESAEDLTKYRRQYVLRLGDWVLAYNFRETYGDLMNTNQDQALRAWLHRNPDVVTDKSACLPNGKRWSTSRK